MIQSKIPLNPRYYRLQLLQLVTQILVGLLIGSIFDLDSRIGKQFHTTGTVMLLNGNYGIIQVVIIYLP